MSHLYLYCWSIVGSHKLHFLIEFWKIKINRVISELVLIQQSRSFLSVHNNNRSCTHIILLPMYHLFSYWISILWIHTLHCLKVSRPISNNRVVSQWYFIRLAHFLKIRTFYNKHFYHNILSPLFYLYLFLYNWPFQSV